MLKRILAGVVSAAVIVSALAVPTSAELTNTPKTVSKSGQNVVGNKTIRYSGGLTATKTYARASASCTMNVNLLVSVRVCIPFDEDSLLIVNEAKDAILDKAITVSVDNVDKFNDTYDLTYAEGHYVIGGLESFDLVIT